MGLHLKTQIAVLSKVGDDLLFAEFSRRIVPRLKAARAELTAKLDATRLELKRAEVELRHTEAELARLLDVMYPPDYFI